MDFNNAPLVARDHSSPLYDAAHPIDRIFVHGVCIYASDMAQI